MDKKEIKRVVKRLLDSYICVKEDEDNGLFGIGGPPKPWNPKKDRWVTRAKKIIEWCEE